MEWDRKEEMEMEMLLQEISCGHCHWNDETSVSDGSTLSSGSISPSSNDISVTTENSPDSSQQFLSSDDMRASNEPEPNSERRPFEYSVFEAENGHYLENLEFKNEYGTHEYSAFPLEVNLTEPWVHAPVLDHASFNTYCNANPFAYVSRENNDIPVSISNYWRHTEDVDSDSMNMRNYCLNSANLHYFKSKKQNESLVGVKGYVYLLAKDPNGCRFLQTKLEEGKEYIDLIYNGLLSHIIELSVHPFGNYLMQKIIELCDGEQKRQIVAFLTQDPSVLVRISLNIHGTRTVQKLVKSIKMKEEISLVVSALQSGFLQIAKDLNGNHVIQQCLHFFDEEDNKAIFDTSVAHCVETSTDRHGCCVIQKCIAYSTDEQQEKLVDAICTHGLDLSQDAFGNYVVQYLLELKHSSALTKLAYQFEGSYVQLSMQKFSSNVIEKCLKVFTESEKAKIVFELLSVPQFEHMLQHPYSNYVIQAALKNSKGPLHKALVTAIKPHAANLHTNTYGKRIFRKALLRK